MIVKESNIQIKGGKRESKDDYDWKKNLKKYIKIYFNFLYKKEKYL